MRNNEKQQKLLDDMQQDFADSVSMEEMDFETVPAELLEAFGDELFRESYVATEPAPLISDDDFWGNDGLKQLHKR
jgi:hypothetical protein